MKALLVTLLAWCLLVPCLCDTPANCLYDDIVGTWTIRETLHQDQPIVDPDFCDNVDESLNVIEKNFTLEYPNTARDQYGNIGTWTMIYNQGFEININQRSYFAFSYYKGDYISATSYCDQVFNGWARDTTVRHWSCITGLKTTPVDPRESSFFLPRYPNKKFKNDFEMIRKINRVQKSWRARSYKEWEQYTQEEMFLRGGGPRDRNMKLPPTAPATEDLRNRVALLPESFDWRDVDGVNYVSPVRDQENCGSCYAFASMANIEANLRILTDNERQDIFSPQDANDCSYLAQGCYGGFDFLIAGRYAMEQGVVAEECNPYIGLDLECATDMTCDRTYVSSYAHVGGYYGACNEQNMMETLVGQGPISVSFEVYDDFYDYDSGIYHHVAATTNSFNPFEITNHVVLIVGYGVEDGEDFWIVKNSWGEGFGEDGYFRIRRGTDECSIESMAITINVIP